MGTIEEKEIASPRKLGFDFNIDKTFDIKTILFLGQKLIYKYRLPFKMGKRLIKL